MEITVAALVDIVSNWWSRLDQTSAIPSERIILECIQDDGIDDIVHTVRVSLHEYTRSLSSPRRRLAGSSQRVTKEYRNENVDEGWQCETQCENPLHAHNVTYHCEIMCSTYSELPLELWEGIEMNPVHRYDRCVAIRSTYLHFGCCYCDGKDRSARRFAAQNADLPEAEPKSII